MSIINTKANHSLVERVPRELKFFFWVGDKKMNHN